MAAEVFDDKDRVIVRLEAPGMDKKEFDLQVIDDVLIVRGEKRIQRERTEGHYHVKECAYGRFERAIGLPDEVDSDKAQADYKTGILRIELPKLANQRRKRIKVEISWTYQDACYSVGNFLQARLKKKDALSLREKAIMSVFEAFLYRFSMSSPSPAGEVLFILINNKGDPLRLLLPVRTTVIQL